MALLNGVENLPKLHKREAPVVNQYALYWALCFFVIYLLSQWMVLKHPVFGKLTQMQKSVTVKLLAVIGFVVAYGFVRVVSLGFGN